MRMVSVFKSMATLSRTRRSRPSKPSTGLSAGSPWHATVTRLNTFSNNRSFGTTSMGISSFPLAVNVSRNWVARPGWQPMASAALGGMMVVVAPVSRARRTTQLPLGPLSLAWTSRSPASERRGYSGTEKGDGVTLRERFFRVNGVGQPCGLHHSVVYLIPAGRMDQEAASDRLLRPGINPVHRDQQPLSVEPLADLLDRMALHGTFIIPRPSSRNIRAPFGSSWRRRVGSRKSSGSKEALR